MSKFFDNIIIKDRHCTRAIISYDGIDGSVACNLRIIQNQGSMIFYHRAGCASCQVDFDISQGKGSTRIDNNTGSICHIEVYCIIATTLYNCIFIDD